MSKPLFYSRYYPDTPALRGWPFRIRSLGYNNYGPDATFPSGGHPDDHLFSWESGRILPTLTLIHVTGGKGRFRSQPSGELAVPSNTGIFVFPQIRHAYRPDKTTGWNSQWVEVDAVLALPLLKQAGLSASRLRVLFKQATGLSPKQYQLALRMERAARLLSDGALPVGMIAEQTGYDSIYHFSRQFKRMLGVSPSQYRAATAISNKNR